MKCFKVNETKTVVSVLIRSLKSESDDWKCIFFIILIIQFNKFYFIFAGVVYKAVFKVEWSEFWGCVGAAIPQPMFSFAFVRRNLVCHIWYFYKQICKLPSGIMVL